MVSIGNHIHAIEIIHQKLLIDIAVDTIDNTTEIHHHCPITTHIHGRRYFNFLTKSMREKTSNK